MDEPQRSNSSGQSSTSHQSSPPFVTYAESLSGLSQSQTPVAQPRQPINGFAIASLILGVLSWLGLFAIGSLFGLIIGLVAQRQIAHGQGGIRGEEFARAGVILSIANLIVSCVALFCVTASLGVSTN